MAVSCQPQNKIQVNFNWIYNSMQLLIYWHFLNVCPASKLSYLQFFSYNNSLCHIMMGDTFLSRCPFHSHIKYKVWMKFKRIKENIGRFHLSKSISPTKVHFKWFDWPWHAPKVDMDLVRRMCVLLHEKISAVIRWQRQSNYIHFDVIYFWSFF